MMLSAHFGMKSGRGRRQQPRELPGTLGIYCMRTSLFYAVRMYVEIVASMSEKSSNVVFVDVDTQFDFMDPDGRLYVSGSERLVDVLQRLFIHAQHAGIPVLSSVDDHAADDPEFAHWPPHCVHGTSGQAKLPLTLLPTALTLNPADRLSEPVTSLLKRHQQIVFPKSTLDAFDNPHFAAAVDALDSAEYVVFGVATDYCVRLAAKGLLRRERSVTVVRDAVRAVADDAARATCAKLSALGVKWAESDEIIDFEK
jgi:nicotinamidase/pyrazinamidase